ncbi:MAG: ABC transporter permease [Candidatus Thermoplasmatota archaeon]|jgi:ABC-2 type transport system permease protein|nr:ABC transporter permease [Candidatus Thermoplasmatota archaeon]MCL5791162.1 ABC transporter permease [Candidatus Thermoplasmatota archaeon]
MSGLIPLTVRELRKWYRNPVFFIVGLLQPIFWIALFGSAFDITRLFSEIPASTGIVSPFAPAPNYITFIVGGILTTTSLFTAMFSGTSLIFDRRLGNLGRFLVSPIRRSSIVFSKILSTTIRILVQAIILIGAALLIPNGLVLAHGINILDVIIIAAALIMVAFSFSSLFSIIAIRLRKQETIFGIINLINLPLLFASYALFPSGLMATWLANVANYNPVSWSAVSIRTVIEYGNVMNGSQFNSVMLYLLYLFLLSLFMIILTIFLSEKEIRD